MNKDTFIEHKEAIVVCEEKGHVSLNYNVLLTTPKANIITKPTILSLQQNQHQLVPIVVKHVIPLRLAIIGKKGTNSYNHLVKSTKLVAKTKTQLVVTHI
jgi:hypothetical protein